ncbi:hypothetical protein ACFW3Z_18515 [Nocardiopsis alba]|uniref:hypothetical protein n=1 Tax=Nocardiopsis alba TaxID=53437 RepID=UPI0033BD16B0
MGPKTQGLSSQEPDVDAEQLNQLASAYTVERIFIEQDQEEIIDSTTERQYDDLIEVGALLKGEGEYIFNPDSSSWEAAATLSDRGVPIARIYNALDAILFANNVTWCGGEIRGTEFVHEYMEEFKEEFDTYEEYEQSIADYVDCGTGE